MNRRQRRAHVAWWSLLTLVMATTFLAALAAKTRVETAARQAQTLEAR